MDLLYLHVSNIPEGETLKGVYIVDGTASYASTQTAENVYRLYTTINHSICEFVHQTPILGQLDTFVANRHSHIMEQSGRYEKDIKVVSYKTNQFFKNSVKKPSSERQEISRYSSTRRKRLF